MRQWHACVWIVTLVAWANGACAAERVGPLEVRAAPGRAACFTISQAEELRHGAPQFDAISVTDAINAKVVMWTMAMPRERTFALSYRMCVPYAGRLPVLPQTPAQPLVAGRMYEAAITVRAPAAGAPRRYRARFCVRGHRAAVVPAAVCPPAFSP